MDAKREEILKSLQERKCDELLESYKDNFDVLTEIGIFLANMKNPRGGGIL